MHVWGRWTRSSSAWRSPERARRTRLWSSWSGELSASGLLIVMVHLQAPDALARFSESLGYCREVGAHNLPLPALFAEDQGSSAMDREGLAVFGDSRKHVVSIYDAHVIAVHATRWLPEAEAGESKARDDLVEILGKKGLTIEPVGNVVKYFHILGKHVQGGLDVALIEGVGELLC